MTVVNLEQGSQEWLDMRRNKIGASDAPIILGLSPWKTPLQLYNEKKGITTPMPMNPAMRRGIELEPVIRKIYNETYDYDVEPLIIQDASYDYLMVSYDGISKDHSHIVEFKCPGLNSHNKFFREGIPLMYLAQMQLQLFVSNAETADFVSYFPGHFSDEVYKQPIKRDQKFIDKMLPMLHNFYQCMINSIPPELSEKDFVQRIDHEWRRAAFNYNGIAKELKELKELEKEARKALVDLAGDESCKGGGIKLSHYKEKGRVDYTAIPELENVNLDKYRKEPIEKWRITIDG